MLAADRSIDPAGDHRIVFNLPFYTARIFDSRRSVADGGGGLHARLREIVDSEGDWHFPALKDRDSGMKRDVDDRRGQTFAPHYLVERRFDRPSLETASATGGCTLDFEEDAMRLAVRDLAIRHFESGFGSALFACDLAFGANATIAGIRDFVESVSSRLNCFADIFAECTAPLDDARIDSFRLDQKVNVRPGRDGEIVEKGAIDLLWAHRIFLLEASKIAPAAPCEETARRIVFRYTPGPLIDASIRDDMAIFVGSGNSLLLAEPEVPMAERMLLARAIQMQIICYARAEDFDGDLFFYLNSLSLSAEGKAGIKQTIDDLESRSNDIVDLLENATLFRAIVEDYVYSLDPQSLVIWNALSDCWGTSRRFDAIDTKLQSMERLYDRTRNSLKSLYDSQLNALVFWFTAFTVLAVLVDLVQFITTQGPLAPLDFTRLALLLAGGMLIFTGVRILLRRRS